MMYTTDSPLTGHSRPNPAWLDVLRTHGATFDPAQIILIYDDWCQQYNINPDLALAQACLESAYFTSARWVNEWNPAGLGITADNTPPNPFLTPGEGIRAHIQHICCYVYTADTCPVDHAHLADRRHSFHDGKPRVADLIRPERKWAVPGTTYAAHIVQIANDVTGGTVSDTPYDRTHDAADVGPSRALADIKWFVVHDTEGLFAGDENVLTNAALPIESAHFILGKEPGQCVYSVPLDRTAWTPGNDAVAVASVNVEMSGYADAHDGGYTDYQYEKLAEIFRWCVAQGVVNVPPVYIGRVDADAGPLPDQPGIIGHSDVPDGAGGWGGSSHHTDPGPTWDWNRFIALIEAAPVTPAARLTDGHALGVGFTDYVAALDSLPANLRLRELGTCLTDEYDGYLCTAIGGGKFKVASVRCVTFERGKLLWDRGATPPPWDVRRPLENELCGPPDQMDVAAVLGNAHIREDA